MDHFDLVSVGIIVIPGILPVIFHLVDTVHLIVAVPCKLVHTGLHGKAVSCRIIAVADCLVLGSYHFGHPGQGIIAVLRCSGIVRHGQHVPKLIIAVPVRYLSRFLRQEPVTGIIGVIRNGTIAVRFGSQVRCFIIAVAFFLSGTIRHGNFPVHAVISVRYRPSFPVFLFQQVSCQIIAVCCIIGFCIRYLYQLVKSIITVAGDLAVAVGFFDQVACRIILVPGRIACLVCGRYFPSQLIISGGSLPALGIGDLNLPSHGIICIGYALIIWVCGPD